MAGTRLSAFDQAAGPQVVICASCKGPRRDAPHHVIVVAPATVPTCPACDGPLAEDGLSGVLLTDQGSFPPMVVQLEDSPSLPSVLRESKESRKSR